MAEPVPITLPASDGPIFQGTWWTLKSIPALRKGSAGGEALGDAWLRETEDGTPPLPQVVFCPMFVTMNQSCAKAPFVLTVPRPGLFGSPRHHFHITRE